MMLQKEFITEQIIKLLLMSQKKGESIYSFINATKILNSIGVKVPRVHIQDNENLKFY